MPLRAKRDAPSGTAPELAERLATVNTTTLDVPVGQTGGPIEARGAAVAGTRVHRCVYPASSTPRR